MITTGICSKEKSNKCFHKTHHVLYTHASTSRSHNTVHSYLPSSLSLMNVSALLKYLAHLRALIMNCHTYLLILSSFFNNFHPPCTLMNPVWLEARKWRVFPYISWNEPLGAFPSEKSNARYQCTCFYRYFGVSLLNKVNLKIRRPHMYNLLLTC